jgi:hypothetical protein
VVFYYEKVAKAAGVPFLREKQSSVAKRPEFIPIHSDGTSSSGSEADSIASAVLIGLRR